MHGVGGAGRGPQRRIRARRMDRDARRRRDRDVRKTGLPARRRVAGELDGDIARVLDTVSGLGVLMVADGVVALTPLGSGVVRAWLGLGTATSDVLRVKVTLRDSADPVVWRRLRVSADIRLDRICAPSSTGPGSSRRRVTGSRSDSARSRISHRRSSVPSTSTGRPSPSTPSPTRSSVARRAPGNASPRTGSHATG